MFYTTRDSAEPLRHSLLQNNHWSMARRRLLATPLAKRQYGQVVFFSGWIYFWAVAVLGAVAVQGAKSYRALRYWKIQEWKFQHITLLALGFLSENSMIECRSATQNCVANQSLQRPNRARAVCFHFWFTSKSVSITTGYLSSYQLLFGHQSYNATKISEHWVQPGSTSTGTTSAGLRHEVAVLRSSDSMLTEQKHFVSWRVGLI